MRLDKRLAAGIALLTTAAVVLYRRRDDGTATDREFDGGHAD